MVAEITYCAFKKVVFWLWETRRVSSQPQFILFMLYILNCLNCFHNVFVIQLWWQHGLTLPLDQELQLE